MKLQTFGLQGEAEPFALAGETVPVCWKLENAQGADFSSATLRVQAGYLDSSALPEITWNSEDGLAFFPQSRQAFTFSTFIAHESPLLTFHTIGSSKTDQSVKLANPSLQQDVGSSAHPSHIIGSRCGAAQHQQPARGRDGNCRQCGSPGALPLGSKGGEPASQHQGSSERAVASASFFLAGRKQSEVLRSQANLARPSLLIGS